MAKKHNKHKDSESYFKSIVGEIIGEIIWNILTFLPRMLFHFLKHIFKVEPGIFVPGFLFINKLIFMKQKVYQS